MDTPENLIYGSLGARYTCVACTGIITQDRCVIPISSFLKDIASIPQVSKKIFLSDPQDIVVLRVNCFETVDPVSNVTKDSVEFKVNSLTRGIRHTTSEFEVFSISKDNVLIGKYCRVKVMEGRAHVKSQYQISQDNDFRREKIASILPIDASTCENYGKLCLNKPLREDLSYTLLKTSFDVGQLTVLKSRFFPDPAQYSMLKYEIEIRKFIGIMLLNAALEYVDGIEPAQIYSEDQYSTLEIDSSLKILTIIASSICVVMSVGLILIDIVQLDKVPNTLLRKLSKSIQPGINNLKTISEYVANNSELKLGSGDWDTEPVRFGEDRRTVGEATGLLRFGGKKDVVKFKDDRTYH